LEAAKKSKAKAKGKKGKVEEEVVDEVVVMEEEPEEVTEEVFDLETKNGFDKAMKSKITRPFIFGPIEFKGLNSNENEYPFDYE